MAARRDTKKNGKDKAAKKPNEFFESYKSFCYRTIGKQLEKRGPFESVDETMRMANMSFTAELYLSIILMNGLIASAVSFVIFLIAFGLIIGGPNWVLYFLGLTGLTTAAAMLILPISANMRISNRRTYISREMSFTLSELSIFASTGLSPIEIMRRVAKKQGGMGNEFRKLVYKLDVEGKDIMTALGQTAKESPSNEFRETLWDLSNMIHLGGDLDEYLRKKADQTMQLKRDVQKEFIERLAQYLDMYVSLILVGVLFLGIAAFLMDAMGSTMGGLDADGMLLVLAYLVLPVALTAIGLMISSAYNNEG